MKIIDILLDDTSTKDSLVENIIKNRSNRVEECDDISIIIHAVIHGKKYNFSDFIVPGLKLTVPGMIVSYYAQYLSNKNLGDKFPHPYTVRTKSGVLGFGNDNGVKEFNEQFKSKVIEQYIYDQDIEKVLTETKLVFKHVTYQKALSIYSERDWTSPVSKAIALYRVLKLKKHSSLPLDLK